MQTYSSIEAMLSSLSPVTPVYCVHPQRIARATSEFLDGCADRVLYAIKANNEPAVLDQLWHAGVRHFDCASLDEIGLITSHFCDAVCYFMNPVRLPGAASRAFRDHGVRHFMVDDLSALPSLAREIDTERCVIFARMAVHHESAVEDLSSKFGASPEDMPEILTAIGESGAEPALAFNVGSLVRSPDAYAHAIDVAHAMLSTLSFRIRLVDIGGGFPRLYPGFETPPLAEFFDAIRRRVAALPLADDAELLVEPGRALCAEGLSTVVRVLLRKNDRLYINDGMYGAFWELRFDGHKQYPTQVYRDALQLDGESQDFDVFGPTCDSNDRLPEPFRLPRDIAEGDYIEFSSTGAYSLSGRTDFNGFHDNTVVTIRP